jgi:hypothetical protein
MAERSGRERWRLDDSGSYREEMGMGVECEGNSSELRGDREPSNGAVGEKEMAASAGGRGWREAGIIDRESRGGTETNGKVGNEGMKRVGRNDGSSRDGRCSSGGGNENGSRRDRRSSRGTFQRVRMRRERSGVIGGRTSGTVSEIELEGNFEMLGDERMVEASKTINISHHTRWAMKDVKEVSEELLGPATNLVDGAIVLQYLFDSTAVAEPIEFRAPEKFAVLANTPAPAASFAHKGMVVTFAFSAAAGAEANRAQAGPIHGEVEGADTFGAKESKGDFGCFRIIWLHEDPAHASSSPICFEEARKGGVVTSKARRGGDCKLQFVPEVGERLGPLGARNRFAVVLALEGAKRLDTNFKVWAIDVVEGEEADERTQGLAIDGQRPIVHQIELGLGGTVAIGSDIVANIFDAVR